MKEQRTILITGCSTGIGKHCAIRLKEDGWHVFATARKSEDLEMLAGLGLTPLQLDYADSRSVQNCFAELVKETGGNLDALFNNGAYGQTGAVEDLSRAVLRNQFEANFFGWHELTNLCLPVMRDAGQGRIVHCSSILGWVTSPWRGAYNASKFALEGLASTMRLELSDTNIHISLIEPGPIESEFVPNCLEVFLETIDYENSVYSEIYKKELKRLNSRGGTNRFRLGPEAVYKKLDHALNAPRPKAHYGVTVPTHVMNVARRVLPTRMLDKILIRGS